MFRLLDFVRDSGVEALDGVPLPKKRSEWPAVIDALFNRKRFKLDYECPRMAYRRVGRSTDERTIIAAVLPPDIFFTDTLTYRVPLRYDLDSGGKLAQVESPECDAHVHAALMNSLVLNYYIRNKISATVNMFYAYELPIPKLTAKQRERLAEGAAKLSKKPGDTAGRAKLEVFIARDLYGLDAADWEHLTGTFTFGGESESKRELDAIIRLSREGWAS